MRGLVTGILLAVGLSCQAGASILPTLLSQTSLGGGIFAYTYQIIVQAPDQEVAPSATGPAGTYNNHFTFVDFVGLTGTPASSGLIATSFSAPSITATGPAAFSQSPTDSAAISNVTWTYSGTATIAPGTTLGTVTLDSNFGTMANSSQQFEGQATVASGTSTGTVTGNSALTAGLVVVFTPEPQTWALLGTALFSLILLRKKVTA